MRPALLIHFAAGYGPGFERVACGRTIDDPAIRTCVLSRITCRVCDAAINAPDPTKVPGYVVAR